MKTSDPMAWARDAARRDVVATPSSQLV